MTAFSDQRFAELAKNRLRRFGTALTVLQSTPSTNDYAVDAAKAGASDGSVFLAEEQSRGRGRQGNTWSSAAGENLLFSLLLRTSLPLEKISALTLAVGLGVRDGLSDSAAAPLSVKWPNDVLADGRKLAGILIETQSRGAAIESVVVGVGINVLATEFPEDVRETATSLALLSPALAASNNLEREAVLVNVLEHLEDRIATYETSGLAPLHDELNKHDALRGKRVEVDNVTGEACGIDKTGRLLIKKNDGQTIPIVAGTVRLLG